MTDAAPTWTWSDSMVDAAGLDSFPASDPPSWWSGAETRRPGADGDPGEER